MTTRYLDPTNDAAFKRLFGTENHKPLLISFLNAILDRKGKNKIRSVEFLPQDQAPPIKGIKSSILDIQCTDESGRQYIVEMQNSKIPDFLKRSQYYLSNSYVSQLSKGSAHFHLKPIVLLAIANYPIFPKKQRCVSYHQTLDTHTHENDLEDLAYAFVELPKFKKSEDELETVQDKWIYFFKNWHDSKDIPKSVNEEELIEAYHVMEQFNWDRFERETYLKAKIAQDEEALVKAQEFEKGKDKAKIEIAYNLLSMDMDIEEIVLATGLSKQQVKELESPEILRGILETLKAKTKK